MAPRKRGGVKTAKKASKTRKRASKRGSRARDPEQAWFWNREWQKREREADRDIAAGRLTVHKTDDEFLKNLKKRKQS
jgi:hypothetical protein